VVLNVKINANPVLLQPIHAVEMDHALVLLDAHVKQAILPPIAHNMTPITLAGPNVTLLTNLAVNKEPVI